MPADAEAEFRQVLDAQLRVPGPGHPSALATRHEIASVLALQVLPDEIDRKQLLECR